MMSMPLEMHDNCCRVQTIPLNCPVCGRTGRKVSALTLDHHLAATLRGQFTDTAGFCPNPTCEVVYFNGGGALVRKGETMLPVTVKDPGDSVYVCYCFGFKRADIRRDILQKGKTDILDRIKKNVQEGRCDCERKNPQGACCLGNVANAIKQAVEREQNPKGGDRL